MTAVKEATSLEDRFETTTALRYRIIKKEVKNSLSEATDEQIAESNIIDIMTASIFAAEEYLQEKNVEIPEKEINLEEITDSLPDSAKKQIEKGLENEVKNNKYIGAFKSVGNAGLKILSYAMIPLKNLYNWIADKYFSGQHKKSIKGALKKSDVPMSELNKKTGYDMEKVRKRVYSAISYIATTIVDAIRTRLISDEKERKDKELKTKMEKFYSKNNFAHYIPDMTEHVPIKEIKPYVVQPIEDNKLRAVVMADSFEVPIGDYAKAENTYFNRQKGNVWSGKDILLDPKFPQLHDTIRRMHWKTFHMNQDTLGHGYMKNKH